MSFLLYKKVAGTFSGNTVPALLFHIMKQCLVWVFVIPVVLNLCQALFIIRFEPIPIQ
jgi:hypothetical protein